MSKTILAVGAHYDDAEMSCGGTLYMHVMRGDKVVVGITNSDDDLAGDPKKRYLEQLEANVFSRFNIITFCSMDEDHSVIKELDDLHPDIIFVPFKKDTHQHHIRASRIGMSVGRKKYITTYIYDSGSAYDFHPNVFSLIDFDLKLKLVKHFKSQIERKTIKINIIKKKEAYWASLITDAEKAYAEAFIVRKLIYRRALC